MGKEGARIGENKRRRMKLRARILVLDRTTSILVVFIYEEPAAPTSVHV